MVVIAVCVLCFRWDKKSLDPGVSWREGFCNGLVKSRIFMALLSREAINHPTENRQNFSRLTTDSKCDNVLLEQWLALELQTRGLVEKIYPVLIGDCTTTGHNKVFSNYFSAGCGPDFLPNCVVEDVQLQVEDQLNRLCLGTPLMEDPTVANIVNEVTKNQGHLFEGKLQEAAQSVLTDVLKMLHAVIV
jgi:hypothetical protein